MVVRLRARAPALWLGVVLVLLAVGASPAAAASAVGAGGPAAARQAARPAPSPAAAASPPPAFAAASPAPLSPALVALAPTPPMGWNPWYEFGCDTNEQIVEQTAETMATSGMEADGYRYVNLDDCWMASERDATGALQADPRLFPDGIASVAAFVHAIGLKLGAYLDVGTQTCMERPGSASHYARDVATMASWGVDFLKADYCYTNFIPPQPVYSSLEQAILATGRPMVLSVADDGFDYPWRWGPGLATMWRTTNDYTAYGAASGNWWGAVLQIASINAGLSRFARPGAWNDPDVLLTGTGLLSPAQERSQFSLWSMMAAPLLVGGDVRSMSPASASIVMNRDVIAVDQDRAGIQGRRIADSHGHQVWLRKLADGSRAVLFLNTDRAPAAMTLAVARAGIPPNARYTIRDLWAHRSYIGSAPAIHALVYPDDVVMVRIRALPRHA